MAKLALGKEAPSFELPGTGGRTYRLADYADTGVILAFYPGDFTPVCTKQFCSYRDDGDRIEALGVPDARHLAAVGGVPRALRLGARADGAAPLRRGPARGPRLRRPRPRRARPPLDLPRRPERRRPLPARRPASAFATRTSTTSSAAVAELRQGEPDNAQAEPFDRGRTRRRWRASALGKGPRSCSLHGITATRRYVLHGSRSLPRGGIASDLLRRPRPRRVGPGARGRGLLVRRARRRPWPGRSMQACDRPARPRRPLDGLSHRRRVRAREPGRRGRGRADRAPPPWGCRPRRRRSLIGTGSPTGSNRPGSRASCAPTRPICRRPPSGARPALRIHPRADGAAPAPAGPRAGAARGAALDSLRRRSRSWSPFGLPALVVASHDEADPGHPLAVAEAWAERLPDAELIGEEPGQSPLAWQGGRLSRAIAEFCDRLGL